MNDQLKKIMIGCGAGFVILIIILALLSSCQKHSYTYDELESKMIQIAKRYFENNEEELPTTDKETNEYSLREMISNGDLKETSELLGEDAPSCDGGVTVINNNGYYLYTVSLECGDKHSTQTLKDKIIEDQLVEEGHGLWELDNEYIFKGQNVNNWIKFAGQTWRIVGINEEGNIKLIQYTTKNESKWDGHYNVEEKESGINTYYTVTNDKSSTIKEVLDTYYNNEDVFSEDDKSYMTTQTLCIGKRSDDDTTKNGESECSETLPNQTFGLIAAYEVLRTSLDDNCNRTVDAACRNYNWLFTLDKNTWTLTASTEKSTRVYELPTDAAMFYTRASNTVKYLATVTIDQRVSYQKGTGTEEDPYILGVDKD